MYLTRNVGGGTVFCDCLCVLVILPCLGSLGITKGYYTICFSYHFNVFFLFGPMGYMYFRKLHAVQLSQDCPLFKLWGHRLLSPNDISL